MKFFRVNHVSIAQFAIISFHDYCDFLRKNMIAINFASSYNDFQEWKKSISPISWIFVRPFTSLKLKFLENVKWNFEFESSFNSNVIRKIAKMTVISENRILSSWNNVIYWYRMSSVLNVWQNFPLLSKLLLLFHLVVRIMKFGRHYWG